MGISTDYGSIVAQIWKMETQGLDGKKMRGAELVNKLG